MPIFDQGYQHWRGRLSGHLWRWLTITEQGVRMQMRRRGTRWLVFSGFSPALLLALALVVWGLLEQQSTLLDPIKFLFQNLPEEIKSGPKAYRTAFWTMAFEVFFRIQTPLAMILVLLVGPDLISQDLRFNAMPLYFSRPLRRIDYFLGKLGVIAVFLMAVTILPALAAYVLGVAFSFELSVFRDTLPLLLGALAFGAVLVLSSGTLMLAISSLTRNARFVGAAWLAFWIVSNFAADSLKDSVGKDWCPAVSYTADLKRVREELLGVAAARDQFLELVEKARETAQMAARAASPFGNLGRRRGGRFAPPPPAETPAKRPPPMVLRLAADDYPWTWSAGVLGGLFVVSTAVLATRVKSLDRLK